MCGLLGKGASTWRAGLTMDGPWNQPLTDRRHFSSDRTSDTWNNIEQHAAVQTTKHLRTGCSRHHTHSSWGMDLTPASLLHAQESRTRA